MTINDITSAIEKSAPLVYAETWDNSGFQVGDPQQEVTKILLSLDFCEEVLDEAISKKANLIITHHPFIFNPIKKITTTNYNTRLIIKAIKNDISIYAAHTNLDNAFNGLNYLVASKLHLSNCTVLDATYQRIYKIVTFVPLDYLDSVREAMFEAGGGCIGDYDSCSYYSKGEGTFKANEGTHPFVGKINEIHYEQEYRLEIIVPEHSKNNVIKALREMHPYEEPAIDIIALDNKYERAGSGVTGYLSESMNEEEFLELIKVTLGIPCLRHSQFTGKKISKVSICTGAGAFLLSKALSNNSDVFITGDVRHHEFFVPDNKMLLVDAGHFETEQLSRQWFYRVIKDAYPLVDVEISQKAVNPVKYY